jgi:hypothetical protein
MYIHTSRMGQIKPFRTSSGRKNPLKKNKGIVCQTERDIFVIPYESLQSYYGLKSKMKGTLNFYHYNIRETI